MPKLILGKVVGDDGKRGNKWYTGTSIVGTSTMPLSYNTSITDAIEGDMYVNTDTGNIYECVSGGTYTIALWKYVFSMLLDKPIPTGNYISEESFTCSHNATSFASTLTQDGNGVETIYFTDGRIDLLGSGESGYLHMIKNKYITQVKSELNSFISSVATNNENVIIATMIKESGNDVFLVSFDNGLTFNSNLIAMDAQYSNVKLYNITYNEGNFIAVGTSNNTGIIVVLSPIKRQDSIVGYQVDCYPVVDVVSSATSTIYDMCIDYRGVNDYSYIAVGQNGIFYSTDLTNWSMPQQCYDNSIPTQSIFYSITSNQIGNIVTVGECDGNGIAYYSYDGGSNFIATNLEFNSNIPKVVEYINGKFWIGTTDGSIYVSDNGIDWKRLNYNPKTIGEIYSLYGTNEGCILVGSKRKIFTLKIEQLKMSEIVSQLYNKVFIN